MPANMTSPISNIEPKPSDNPRCDISAASPSPAAMPAIGPSQRDMPEGAGAGAAVGAFGAAADAGAAGWAGDGVDCEAELPAGATGAAFCGAMLRCAPKLPPPPMRLASAMPFRVSVNAANAARVRIVLLFIVFLHGLQLEYGGEPPTMQGRISWLNCASLGLPRWEDESCTAVS